MSWFGEIFSSGVGNIIEQVGDAFDKNLTSDQERLEMENEQRRAEMEYKVEMRSLDVQEKSLFLADVDSARDNQSRVQESENAGWLAKNIQPLLALVLVGLTFAMFSRVLFGSINPNSHESTISMMILGSLATIITQVVSYFFGSSRDSEGNARKNAGFSIISPKR